MMIDLALSTIGQVIALAALTMAALHDVAVRTVPNRLVALVCGGALLDAFALQRGIQGFAMATAMLSASCLLWHRGWVGGGDVKLLAASAPLLEPSTIIDLLLAVSLAGGVLALPYLPGRCLFPPPPLTKREGRSSPSPLWGGPGWGRLAAPASGLRRADIGRESLIARIIRCERWRLSRRGPLPYAVAIAAGVFLVLFREG